MSTIYTQGFWTHKLGASAYFIICGNNPMIKTRFYPKHNWRSKCMHFKVLSKLTFAFKAGVPPGMAGVTKLPETTKKNPRMKTGVKIGVIGLMLGKMMFSIYHHSYKWNIMVIVGFNSIYTTEENPCGGVISVNDCLIGVHWIKLSVREIDSTIYTSDWFFSERYGGNLKIKTNEELLLEIDRDEFFCFFQYGSSVMT